MIRKYTSKCLASLLNGALEECVYKTTNVKKYASAKEALAIDRKKVDLTHIGNSIGILFILDKEKIKILGTFLSYIGFEQQILDDLKDVVDDLKNGQSNYLIALSIENKETEIYGHLGRKIENPDEFKESIKDTRSYKQAIEKRGEVIEKLEDTFRKLGVDIEKGAYIEFIEQMFSDL